MKTYLNYYFKDKGRWIHLFLTILFLILMPISIIQAWYGHGLIIFLGIGFLLLQVYSYVDYRILKKRGSVK